MSFLTTKLAWNIKNVDFLIFFTKLFAQLKYLLYFCGRNEKQKSFQQVINNKSKVT